MRRRKPEWPAGRGKVVTYVATLIASCIGIFLVIAVTGATTTNDGNVISMQSVSAAQLGAAHLHLVRPNSGAAVSRGQAEQTARAAFPMAGAVREAQLAFLDSPNYPSYTGKLYWVVSLELNGLDFPSSGPPPRGHKVAHAQPSYLLVFIDADTGKFVFASMG